MVASPPQSKVMLPPPASAVRSASSVQLAGVPVPTTASLGRGGGGSGTSQSLGGGGGGSGTVVVLVGVVPCLEGSSVHALTRPVASRIAVNPKPLARPRLSVMERAYHGSCVLSGRAVGGRMGKPAEDGRRMGYDASAAIAACGGGATPRRVS